MTTATETTVKTQVFSVFIKATPQAIWDAITEPEWNRRYGYPGHSEYDLRPGGKYRGIGTQEMVDHGAPSLEVVSGEVLEVDPPHRLVQTWRMNFVEELRAEPFQKVTWEIEEEMPGLSKLVVTHEVEGAPLHEAAVIGLAPIDQGGGGWPLILSDLKSLLETGAGFHG
jgi:uncharacterized protein YndB with AHSA1/START domain